MRLRKLAPIRSILVAAAASFCLTLVGRACFAQSCVPGSDYTTATAPGTIGSLVGFTDIGNHCDDCATGVVLPFPARIYDQGPFPTVFLSSNGIAQFPAPNLQYSNNCLPNALSNNGIFAHWDDLSTIAGGCVGAPCGIHTLVTGTAPDRVFRIVWATTYISGAGAAMFELRLHEAHANFEVIYGTLAGGGLSATTGVQRTTGSQFTQFSCNTALPNNTEVSYTCPLPVELLRFGVE